MVQTAHQAAKVLVHTNLLLALVLDLLHDRLALHYGVALIVDQTPMASVLVRVARYVVLGKET